MTARTTTRAHRTAIDSSRQGEQPALAGKEYLTTTEFNGVRACTFTLVAMRLRNWAAGSAARE